MKKLVPFLIVSGVAALLAGCPRPPEKPQVLELEPMFITILQSGPKVEVKDYDMAELFHRAEELFRKGEVARARKLYLLVASDAGEGQAAGLAWFNVALCELALDKPGAALEAVRNAQPLITEPASRTQLELMEVRALAMTGDWAGVKTKAPPLLEHELSAEWGAQLGVYLGQAHFLDQELDQAEQRFKEAVQFILHSVTLRDQYGHKLLAEAWYRLGMVHKALFARLPFKLPLTRMTVDMTDKLALMRQAEEYLLTAVRTRNGDWSPRAGYEVAELYHTFAMDLIRAETPPDLNELEMQVYTEELNKKVLPFLRKAESIHANNVSMCDTYRFTTPWQGRSRTRLEAVRKLIDTLQR